MTDPIDEQEKPRFEMTTRIAFRLIVIAFIVVIAIVVTRNTFMDRAVDSPEDFMPAEFEGSPAPAPTAPRAQPPAADSTQLPPL